MKTTALIVCVVLVIVALSGCVDETALNNDTNVSNESTSLATTGKELAAHGDFETQESKECWKFFAGSPTSQPQASGKAHEGVRALAITNKESNESYWTYKPECVVAITEGKAHELTAWIKTDKADVGDIGGAHVILEFLDNQEAKKPLKSKTSTSVKIAKEGEWAQVSAKETAPAGSKFARVKLVISGTGTATFDDVKIVEQ